MGVPVKAGARPSGVTLTWSNDQIAMIRRSCAKDANDIEFDHFISMCRHLQLNPMARQAYCNIYSPKDPKKRKSAFIIAIDGYRAIAQRSGDYMPGKEPEWEYGAKETPLNPLGIVYARATVKKYSHGEWHEFQARAYWNEYAPQKDEWIDGKRTGRQVLSGKWAEMERHMIAKCAEALALRKGWPELFSGTHTPEEWDREAIDGEFTDVTPSQAVQLAEHSKRSALVQEKIGGPGILFLLDDEVKNVPFGKIHSTLDEFISKSDTVQVVNFVHRNTDGMRLFFEREPEACLDIKRKVEAAQAKLNAEVEAAEQSFKCKEQQYA